MRSGFTKGMSHGIPICLGYLSVSFGFGILAVRSGLSVFQSAMISATNLTSAGQLGGVEVIRHSGKTRKTRCISLSTRLHCSISDI